MYSPAIQGMLAQAHVAELRRAAQNPARRSAGAAPARDVTRPAGMTLLMRAKSALHSVLDGGPASRDEAFAINGVQFAGHPPAASRSRDR